MSSAVVLYVPTDHALFRGFTNCCDTREKLDTPASSAIHPPTTRHRREPVMCGTSEKTIATPVVPTVWPTSLAMPSMPLAPPLRLTGTEDTMVRLLGVWNSPKPAPQSMMRQNMS